MRYRWLGVLALAAATPAWAQDGGSDDPRFCPNRPSIGESGCTTLPGQVQLEASTVDWTRDDAPDQRQDALLVGDFQARFGLTATSELQVAWTPFGHVRTRERLGGRIETVDGVGDVQIGYRQNLRHPDGKGLSFAIEPSVTLPVGREPIGAGTWAAGLVVPVTFDLSDRVNVALTNEVDAAANGSGAGRHFALNEVLGLGYALTGRLTAVAEFELVQDNDPDGHQTQALVAGSLAWQPTKRWQLDGLVAVGLNRDTPDLRLLTGGAVLF